MRYVDRYHVRRTDKEVKDEATLKKILKTAQYVTLAMSLNDQPYLVSLSCGYDEERNCVYFHSAKQGKKLDYMRGNNNVWGQALLDHGYDQGECTHLYASVHFSGKAALIEDPSEKRRAMACMTRQLDKDPEPLIAELGPERLGRAVIGRVDIEHMTGKKSKEVIL